MNEKTEKRGYKSEIGLIRFICSALMVYYHLTPILSSKFPNVELYAILSAGNRWNGRVGVICFFILSGMFFQLGHEWERLSFKEFAIKKFFRLWPVMAFSILVNFHTKADALNLFFISSGLGAVTGASSNPASWFACVLFWLFLICFLWFKSAKDSTPPPPPEKWRYLFNACNIWILAACA